ncbi:MAG: EAL domain-containing protein [Gammaproteobacteria bacterium]|nr:EAL domain-containing protein [Gammaproteobacteria bacterium]MDE2252407.1 EAL domain-containing protein [Gammaproteobacteria bacterium]
MSQLSEKTASGIRRRPVPDELGRALLLALGPWRAQSFSLHDSAGDTLWLSAGSLGPDEHGFVLTAIEVFTLEPTRACIHRKLDDGRRALFLAARDPLGGCSGVGCAFIEGGVVDDTRVVTPAVRALLQRFSMLLAPAVDKLQAAAPGDTEGSLPLELPDNTPIRARAYARLQRGTGTRRFEVAVAPIGAQHDAALFERVVDWLVQHRQHYSNKPSSFAIAISAAAVFDRGFAQRFESCLTRNNVDEGLVMLIVPAAAWAEQPERALPLLELCERLHCRVVLDDFVLNDAALKLLRCKAIRMLKLSAGLTAEAMQDRYPRALLSACTHIARVLGIHCVAKQVGSNSVARWLAAAGIDYIDPASPAETDAARTTDEPAALQLVS